jgi:hypothetical protein
VHKKIGAPDNLNLLNHLGSADADGFHLLAVCTGKPNSHNFATRFAKTPPGRQRNQYWRLAGSAEFSPVVGNRD